MIGLRGGLLRFRRFSGELLLLRDRFGLGFLRFFPLARGFLGSLYGFGFQFLGFCLRGLGLFLRFLGIGATLGFSVGISPCFRFALLGRELVGGSFGLSFVFRALLDRHHARFFSRLGSFACSRFDGRFSLFLAIRRFGLHQLLVGLGQN